MRAEEFRDLAETVQADKKAYRVAKERLTLLRRDIVKMIEAAIEEGVPGRWERVLATYQTTISRLPRTAPHAVVESVCMDLYDLWMEIRESLELFAKNKNTNGNESQFDCHIQISKADSHFESESGLGEQRKTSATVVESANLRSLPNRELPLGIVLDACPDVCDLAQGGDIRHWRDFLAAAEIVRPMLGVSASAWSEACEVMGQQQAGISLAAIYQRAGKINNAGGYLRSLTERAREGRFSTWPMIMALLRAKLEKQEIEVRSSKKQSDIEIVGKSGLAFSEALLKSLRRPRL